jgi:hypothetical protein
MTIKKKRNEIRKQKTSKTEKKAEIIKIITTQLIKYNYRCRLKEYMSNKEFKKTKQKNKIIEELLQTERNYLSALKDLIKNYLEPLSSIIDETEIQTLFCNIKQIYKVNSHFLLDLEKEYEKFPNAMISEVLVTHFKHFVIYKDYINNLQKSNELHITLLSKNKKYQTFFYQKNLSFITITPGF